jgi:hypothetical protein
MHCARLRVVFVWFVIWSARRSANMKRLTQAALAARVSSFVYARPAVPQNSAPARRRIGVRKLYENLKGMAARKFCEKFFEAWLNAFNSQ